MWGLGRLDLDLQRTALVLAVDLERHPLGSFHVLRKRANKVVRIEHLGVARLSDDVIALQAGLRGGAVRLNLEQRGGVATGLDSGDRVDAYLGHQNAMLNVAGQRHGMFALDVGNGVAVKRQDLHAYVRPACIAYC